jgi:hypothetical protein
MAFKLKKIVGDGTALPVFANSNITEAVIHSMVAYNDGPNALTLKLQLDTSNILVESVPAYGVFRLTDKINVEALVAVTIDAPVGIEVAVSYLQQSLDNTAALTLVQQAITDASEQAALATYNGDAQVTLAIEQVTAAQNRVTLAAAEVVKCRDQVALAKAALPEGTIDDSTVDTTKAWSSARINTELENVVNNALSPIATSMIFK